MNIRYFDIISVTNLPLCLTIERNEMNKESLFVTSKFLHVWIILCIASTVNPNFEICTIMWIAAAIFYLNYEILLFGQKIAGNKWPKIFDLFDSVFKLPQYSFLHECNICLFTVYALSACLIYFVAGLVQRWIEQRVYCSCLRLWDFFFMPSFIFLWMCGCAFTQTR